MTELRPQLSGDVEAIRALLTAAFETLAEAALVEAFGYAWQVLTPAAGTSAG